LHDLDDLTLNERAKDYVRRAAHSAAEGIREATRLAEEGAAHRCARCGRPVSVEEHARSNQAFQRTFCDGCFDEVFLDRRNFDTKVELNKTIVAKSGTLVQSDGERRIADWLPETPSFRAHGSAAPLKLSRKPACRLSRPLSALTGARPH
jgi:hypothetical protein